VCVGRASDTKEKGLKMTDLNDIDALFDNGIALSKQIANIVSRHASPVTANPRKIYTVPGNTIACHMLTQTNLETLVKSFKRTLAIVLNDKEMQKCLPQWSFRTDDISYDADYNEHGAEVELTNLAHEHIDKWMDDRQDQRIRAALIEMLHGLSLVVASLLYAVYSDDDGIVSDQVIDEHVEFVERTVLSNIENVERYCRPS
jgi:hypothetical protein